MNEHFMTIKKFCPDCNGFGHDRYCTCQSEEDFVVGCCKTCHGEGFIEVQREPRKSILGPYGTEVMVGLSSLYPSKKISPM